MNAFLERGLPLSILVIAAVSAPVMIFAPEGLPRVRALEKELGQVRKENAAQERQIGFLREEVRRLKGNPAAVERLARDELGLVRKNEVVFQFPPSK